MTENQPEIDQGQVDADAMSRQLQAFIWQTLDQTTATYGGAEVPWTVCPHIVCIALTEVMLSVMRALIWRDPATEIPKAIGHVDALRQGLLTIAGMTGPAGTRPS